MSAHGNSLKDTPPRRSFFVNVGALILSRGFVALSQILILPILARALDVADFAVMALAMTVVIFAGTVSDGGFGRSLIRRPDFDRDEWSSVFWLLGGIGLGLAAIVLAVAPLWAMIFDQPQLWAVLSVLSVVPLLQAASAAPNADIERREDYAALARLQVLAATAGMLAAVTLALLGAGIWALVAQQISLAAIRAAGIAWLSHFRPSFSFSRAHLSGHLRFARDTISTSFLGICRTQVTTVAIGKLLGQDALGIFAMQQRFARLPQFGLAGPASAVVFVRMARVQDDPFHLVRTYLASVRLLASALLPDLGVVIAAGPVLFPILLSDKWVAVAPVFALAIPGVALEAVTITCLVCAFRAVDRTDIQLRLIAEGLAMSMPLTLIATVFGLNAVAASVTVWALLFIPRGWHLAREVIPLEPRDALGAVVPSLVVALAAGVAQVAGTKILSLSPWTSLAFATAITVAAYVAIVLLDLRRLRAAIAIFK